MNLALEQRDTRNEEAATLPLLAYQVSTLPLRLEGASATRPWMEETRGKFAKRCLPMLLANAGYVIVTTVAFRARWDGSPGVSGVQVEPLHAGAALPCMSHFGEGLLTFSLPWLFVTPPGYSLLLRGPANLPKDGIAPLEGLVETDRTAATATMNWQLTRPGLSVSFEAGEPICQIVPVKRGELECFAPRVLPIGENAELAASYHAWAASRGAFLQELPVPGSTASAQGWQKDYVQGAAQTKRVLRPVAQAREEER